VSHIREVSPADADAFARWHAALHAGESEGRTAALVSSLDELRLSLAAPSPTKTRLAVGAWDGIDCVGALLLELPQRSDLDTAEVSIAVPPAHRRCGTGDALWRWALVACRCLVLVVLAGRLVLGRSFPFCQRRTTVMPSQKKRPVTLSVQDREDLIRVTTTGVHGASQIMRARVLLALDTSVGEVDPKEVIAARLGVSGETLRLVAKRFADTGSDAHATIARKQRALPPVPSPVTGEVEARLIALACSQPPEGRARWSLRLLEKHVMLVDDIPDLDHSTIGRVLKKRNCVLI